MRRAARRRRHHDPARVLPPRQGNDPLDASAGGRRYLEPRVRTALRRAALCPACLSTGVWRATQAWRVQYRARGGAASASDARPRLRDGGSAGGGPVQEVTLEQGDLLIHDPMCGLVFSSSSRGCARGEWLSARLRKQADALGLGQSRGCAGPRRRLQHLLRRLRHRPDAGRPLQPHGGGAGRQIPRWCARPRFGHSPSAG